MSDPFLLECAAIGKDLRVRAFHGDEELGQPFDYHVWFSLEGSGALSLSPADVLGQAATLSIGTHDGAAQIAGLVAELELCEVTAFALYRVRIVPALHFLGVSHHSRIYVAKSATDILGATLEAAGIASADYAKKLQGSYTARDHVCQYYESDLAFVERWLEREGIYYFFDHSDGSKLTFADAPAPHVALRTAPAHYHALAEHDHSSHDELSRFVRVLHGVAKEVETRDYNYLKPDLSIAEKASIAAEFEPVAEQWAENEPDGPGAAHASKVRAEREACVRDRFHGHGRAFGLHAGFRFDVDRHPVDAMNAEYLVTRARHRGQLVEDGRGFALWDRDVSVALGRETYRVEIDAIPSGTPYRSPRRRPWPRVTGLELARVDGAADDDYAQLDEHGRYVVRFMFDECEAAAAKNSTRIRQIQPHAGATEGHHFPLRKGTEVLVAFVAGDPDRPIIAAAAPNTETPSPVTKKNATQNVSQTGGRSRVEIEDKDGSQYIDISTPPESTFFHLGAHAGLGDHNLVLSTSGDGLTHTGGNRDLTVGGKLTEDVTGDLTETYDANQTTHVSAAFKETIDGGAQQTIHAGLTQTVNGGLTQTIDGGETRTASGGTTETVNGSRTQTVTGASTETINGSLTQTISGASVHITPGTFKLAAAGGINITTSGAMNVLCSDWLMNAPGSQTGVDAFFLSIASENVEVFDLRNDLTLLMIQLQAITIACMGFRNDLFRLKIEVNGVEIKNAGFFDKKGAMKYIIAGLSIAAGGGLLFL